MFGYDMGKFIPRFRRRHIVIALPGVVDDFAPKSLIGKKGVVVRVVDDFTCEVAMRQGKKPWMLSKRYLKIIGRERKRSRWY
jgi:hypothetical protein